VTPVELVEKDLRRRGRHDTARCKRDASRTLVRS
jgi:hypothetical protein